MNMVFTGIERGASVRNICCRDVCSSRRSIWLLGLFRRGNTLEGDFCVGLVGHNESALVDDFILLGRFEEDVVVEGRGSLLF